MIYSLYASIMLHCLFLRAIYLTKDYFRYICVQEENLCTPQTLNEEKHMYTTTITLQNDLKRTLTYSNYNHNNIKYLASGIPWYLQ
jgi:hypothetical protein